MVGRELREEDEESEEGEGEGEERRVDGDVSVVDDKTESEGTLAVGIKVGGRGSFVGGIVLEDLETKSSV